MTMHARAHPAVPPAAPPRASWRLGAGNDPAEAEADAVAARVLGRSPMPIRAEPATSSGMIRRRTADGGVSPHAGVAVAAALGEPGVPLGRSDAAFFGSGMGADLSSVRIHAGAAADRAARSVGARAFALGPHLVFAEGEYRPASAEGRRLLAHELAHVAQGQATPGEATLRRFTRAEEGEIGTLDAVVDQAGIRADASADIPMMMSWGRFTAANGGHAAQEIAASLAGMANEANGGVGPGPSAQPGPAPSPRYIFSCLCGLIDMRHFYQLMYIALISGNAGAVEEGRAHELRAVASSRFAPEDTPSNALGAYFGSQQSIIQRQSVFLANLRAHLGRCHPIDYRALPEDQRGMILDWYAVDGARRPEHQNEQAFPNMERIPACEGLGMFPFVLGRDNEGITNRIVGTVET
jgi:hypothetical protein